MESPIDFDPRNLEPVTSTAAVNDIIVGTSLVLFVLFDEVETQEVRRNPKRYLDDIVPYPRDIPEDFFCRRWQIGAFGTLKTFGPHIPGWLSLKRETQGQRVQSKPASSAKPRNAVLDNSKPRRAHPRFELPPRGSYVGMATLILQCLALWSLRGWFLNHLADAAARKTWIPTWICALFSATIMFSPLSHHQNSPVSVAVPATAYCSCGLVSMIVTSDDKD
ncbi:hypothetical protein BDN67DRAFT_1011857 [Paxillus ammoniavirescens]|nr:hypothetical protein BDN67DRAFT_1011857 [Paxillus ammoniavirescens]